MTPHSLALPHDDRVRSPHTGWCRAHWEAVADHVLAAVGAQTSPAGALVRTSPQQSTTVGLEGFARAALLAAFRAAGDPNPSVRAPLVAWLGRALDVGTRPDHPEAWPRPSDNHQAIVEAAWVAIALWETRTLVWDGLDKGVRSRVLGWLECTHGKAVPPNNWLLYPVIVDAFLQSADYRVDRAANERALRKVDALYHDDGWYSDGPGTNFGHYSAWGVQLLLAYWTRMTGGDEFPRGSYAVKQRLRTFLAEYVHLIGTDGAPVVHGRSPIYRCAVVAPFWLGSMLDATPFAPGETRWIASSVLRHFADRGAFGLGIPPLGWYGEFRPLADAYSTPVSALLTSLAFVGLLLPANDRHWTDREVTVAPDGATTLRVPGMLCLRDGSGIVQVASHGQPARTLVGHAGYRKIGYSNRTAPCTGALGDRDLDGQVSVVTGGGDTLVRRDVRLLGAGDGYASSAWAPAAPQTVPRGQSATARIARRIVGRLQGPRPRRGRDDRVEVASLAVAGVEVRISHLWTFDGGFLLDGGLALSASAAPTIRMGDGWCIASSDDLVHAVIGLHGWLAAGVESAADVSPFGAFTAVPFIRGQLADPEALLVTAHVLTTSPVEPSAVRRSIGVEVVGTRTVVVTSPDACEHVIKLFCPARLPVDSHLHGSYRYLLRAPDGSIAARLG